ncbi:MAG: redoxin domain-containing protein [Bacteroidia bacterium]|nr:MAG: redoxin domain-containing protein [Bacteroidia bacterium]
MAKELLIQIVLIMLLFLSCSQDRKSGNDTFIQRSTEFYETSEYDKALKIVNKGIKQDGFTDDLINTKYKILLAAEKYEEALVIFDTIISRVGDSPDVVIDKIRLLMKLERYDEGLETAMTVDNKYNGSSPYISLMISRIFLAKIDSDNALTWLEKSVEGGFRDYNYLLSEEFESLQGYENFTSLIKKMKKNAGIDSPAEPFSAALFSGGSYNISQDTGKVILIDLWATWCPPCVAEYSNLLELYNKYNEQGFEIVSISADSKREALEGYLERNKIPWINGFSGKGRKDNVAVLYEIDSYPTYIIIDREGIIRSISGEGGDKLNRIVADLILN